MFWPVFLEQTAATAANLLSTMMLAGVGEAAMAGVGMVNAINMLIMNAFTAVGMGVTVIVAQRIGADKRQDAAQAAAQSLTLVVYISIALSVVMIIFDEAILRFLFGGAEQAVLDAARIYLQISSVSLVLTAIFSTIAGIMRATGDSKSPMLGSILSNGVYLAVAYPCIYWLHMGVTGAGMGLVALRLVPALFLGRLLYRGHGGLYLPRLSYKLDMSILRPVMRVAIPSGVDSLLFNGGKLLVQVFLSGMGTTVLAASAISNSLSALFLLPGSAVQIVSVTMVGQSFGARQYRRTRRNILWFTAAAMVLSFIVCAIGIPLIRPAVWLFGASAETAAVAYTPLLLYLICAPLFWPSSFVLPAGLRASGDATFTMWVSITSMFVLRVAGAWFFGVYLGWGLFGVWMSMILDWVGRSAFFLPRVLAFNKRFPDPEEQAPQLSSPSG